jgi:hypothetical protein
MKQIGLALHNYHEAHNLFPYSTSHDGSITGGNPPPPNGVLNHRGWLLLLPYIDQAPLYDIWNPSQCVGEYDRGGKGLRGSAFASGNAKVVSTPINMLLCPSDDGQQFYTGNGVHYRISAAARAAGLYGAKTSYDFSVQRYSSGMSTWTNRGKTTRRMFGLYSNTRMRDIQDGSSNSVAMVHNTLDVKNGVGPRWGHASWVNNGVDLAASEGINYWVCCPWWSNPNSNTLAGRTRNWGAPGSQHEGGIFILMGDGAVRFLSENISNTVRVRLAYIADRQPVGQF